MNSEIYVSLYESRIAAEIGVYRYLLNRKAERPHSYGLENGKSHEADTKGWGIDIEGAIVEFALAKALGRFWIPIATEGHPGDIPGDIGLLQVRSTKHERGRLIIHEEDPDEAEFALALGPYPAGARGMRVILVGSKKAKDAKRADWWDDPLGGRPAFFVPQVELDQMLVGEPQ